MLCLAGRKPSKYSPAIRLNCRWRGRESSSLMRRHSLSREEGRQGDRAFHNAILRATRNDALVVLSASIGAAVSWTTRYKLRSWGLPRDPLPDHQQVFDAIAASDPDAAAAAMRVLVELALDDIRQAVGGQQEAADGPGLLAQPQ